MGKGEERLTMDLDVGMQSPELLGMRPGRPFGASGVMMVGGVEGGAAGGTGGIQSGGGAYSPEKKSECRLSMDQAPHGGDPAVARAARALAPPLPGGGV
jgi:hypothetical protein